METTTVLISLIALITGVLLGYLLIKGKLNMKIGELQAKLSEKENQFNLIKIDFDNSNSELGSLKATNAGLSAKYEEALKAIEDQKTYITESTKSLKEAFGSLSSDALKSNNQSFLDLAKTTLEKHIGDSKADLEKRQQAINSLVKPIEDNLNKFDTNIKELEKNRVGAYTDIKNYLDGMKGTAEKLQKETNTLVGALKTSYIRGKWGEIGLERLVEFSGMSSYCDFSTQVSVTTYDGRLRPDLIVNLPGEKKIIIDAKVPMASYIQAFETNEDLDKKLFIKKHSVALRDHMSKLGAKNYWDQFQGSVDYVIMYLPIESSFGAALEIDPQLIEDGLKDKVILATPTTLVTMLKTIAFSWQQQKVAENIYQIRDAGIELFDRVSILLNHIGSLGNSLNSASKNYNELVGSFESRFVPQVRKLKEVGGSLMKKEVPEINQIETTVRGIKPGLLGNGVVDEKKDSE